MMNQRRNNNAVIRDFNNSLSIIDRTAIQKINNVVKDLNNTINQLNISRTDHPINRECTFFSNRHGTFSRMAHMLGVKQGSINSNGLKLYQVYFLTTMELN